MSNIWADSFSAIREPFFEEKKEKKEKEEPGEKKHKEGPAEEKAEDKKGEKETEDDKPKRWWDDDGDGKGYEEGEVSGKFKKKKKVEEEVEQIDEISQKTATRAFAARATNEFESDGADYNYTKGGKSKADETKRRIEKKHGKAAGQHAERAAHARIFGRKKTALTSMPPKPTKTNEEVELDENRAMARDPEGRKSGYSKQPDPSKSGFTGTGNMSIAQIAKMSARIKKEKETQKEER